MRLALAVALPSTALGFGAPAHAQTQPADPAPRVRMISVTADTAFVAAGRLVSLDDGRPVPGAQVFFGGTDIGAVSDSDGRFMLEGERAGPVELRTRLIGYESVCVRLSLAAGEMRSLLIGMAPVPPEPTIRSPECVEVAAGASGEGTW